MRKFRIDSLFFCIGVFLLVSGCGREPQPAPHPHDGVIIIRGRENPPTLDPAYAVRTFDGHLACLVHGGLVRSGAEGEILPEFARRWEIEDGGRTYRFKLLPDLHFPSGAPLDAEAVVASWNRVCDPETASPAAWVFEDVVGFPERMAGGAPNVSGLKVHSSSEVTIHLREPSSTFLPRLTMPAARIVDLEEVSRKGAGYGRAPLGLGAWKLVEWEDDSHLLFHPNPDYHNANTRIAGIRFDLVSRDFSASARFESGSLHILNPLPASQSAYWKRFPPWRERIHPAPQLNLYYLGFGCHRPPFDDPDVRRAVRKALGVEDIRIILHGEKAEAAFGPIPDGLLGAVSERPPEPDLTPEEREILHNLEMEVWFPDIDPTAALAMEGVQANLSRHGATIRLRRVDRTAYTAWRREGRFDAFLGNWWADFPDPDNFISPLFRSDSDSNTTRFRDPEVDELADLARRETDPQRRAEIYRAIADRIWEQSPMIFLWRLNEEVLTQPWVTGYTPPRLFQGTLYLDLGIEGERQ